MTNFGIIVNKEKDYTSRDVINKLNKILNTKKIGHTGTLDPLAEGVLVCLVGKYTKLVSYIMSTEKEYVAKIKLGIKTDTLDITGNVIEESTPKELTEEEIINVINGMKGEFQQTIPLYSAKHVNGKRLYEYAKDKEEVELPQNTVMIKDIEFISYEDNTITFKCLVSKGTYIRSLIATICDKLNVLGVMSALTRTKQGKFKITDAYTLNDITKNNYKKLNIEDLLDVRVIELNKDIEKLVYNGNKLVLDLDGLILFKKNSEEIALYNFENGEGRVIVLLTN